MRQEIGVTELIALGKIELAGECSLASTFFAISDRFSGRVPGGGRGFPSRMIGPAGRRRKQGFSVDGLFA